MTILALLLLAALVAVILVNLLTGAQTPAVSLIFWHKSDVPLGYVIALSALTGAVITWLAAIPKHVSRFWAIRRLEAALAEKERAYEALAHRAASHTGLPAPTEHETVHGDYQPPSQS